VQDAAAAAEQLALGPPELEFRVAGPVDPTKSVRPAVCTARTHARMQRTCD
jgi:hypothetical protein